MGLPIDIVEFGFGGTRDVTNFTLFTHNRHRVITTGGAQRREVRSIRIEGRPNAAMAWPQTVAMNLVIGRVMITPGPDAAKSIDSFVKLMAIAANTSDPTQFIQAGGIILENGPVYIFAGIKLEYDAGELVVQNGEALFITGGTPYDAAAPAVPLSTFTFMSVTGVEMSLTEQQKVKLR